MPAIYLKSVDFGCHTGYTKTANIQYRKKNDFFFPDKKKIRNRVE